jgi:hypothetical protein
MRVAGVAVASGFLLMLAASGCSQDDAGAADAASGTADGGPGGTDAPPGTDAAAPGDADAGPGGPDAASPPAVGLPYPDRDVYRIKGLMPDFWPDYDAIAGANTGAVSMNMTWWTWEPNVDTPPCDGNEQEYQGRCYRIEQKTDDAIREWTARGVVVTGVLYGAPAWARAGNTNCSPRPGGFDVFCAPDDPAEFARFAGMIAHRYNGLNGHGRIADFAIHNEVNHNIWYDIGCGSGTPCDLDAWVADYAADYNAAYDAIKAEQSAAKVLVPFDQHWGSAYDLPNEEYPSIGAESFLARFAPLAGTREWKMAFHPYPKSLFAPQFDAKDLPNVTFGNVGVLVGHMRKEFPNDPHAWEVQLTEQGINSGAPQSTEAAQAQAICDAYYNVLATPGITSFIYYRMQDHGQFEGGLRMGLARDDGSLKPSWPVWANMNRNDLSPPQLSCGFENLPYTVLTRGFSWDYGHWTSSRRLPNGFDEESSNWKLLRNWAAGTALLYECQVGGHNMLTRDVSCGGNQPLGPVGYIWTSQQPGTAPLYACSFVGDTDNFASTDPDCEGVDNDGLLGYVLID